MLLVSMSFHVVEDRAIGLDVCWRQSRRRCACDDEIRRFHSHDVVEQGFRVCRLSCEQGLPAAIHLLDHVPIRVLAWMHGLEEREGRGVG